MIAASASSANHPCRPAARLAVGLATLVAASLAVASCAPLPKPCTTLVPEPQYEPDTVQVAFLGVGGVIVRWQGAALMTVPLYSNPTVGEMALSEIHTDRQRIEELMRPTLHDVTTVRAILAGHSHFDHLMDAPYIALHRATNADIIGNDAMVKLLDPIASHLGTRQLVSLQHQAPGSYYPVANTRFQIRAVISQHSPQIGKNLLHGLITFPDVSLWRGEDEYPARELPVRAGTWTGGTTLAFVIELLEPLSDDVAFRIYYQDSSTKPPYGFPDWPNNATAYHLAILCMGGATEYPSFPGDIVTYLHPKYVIGIHWEDFFNPRPLPTPGDTRVSEQLAFAPGVNERKFLKAVNAAQEPGGAAMVPCPDQVMVFRRAASGGWTSDAPSAPWRRRPSTRQESRRASP